MTRPRTLSSSIPLVRYCPFPFPIVLSFARSIVDDHARTLFAIPAYSTMN